ncbi:nitroreductase [Limosilactobacillus reuteri]|uniref:nitroreductase n=1 Tax=Limosilactobacillus reuteri TaxID=1598 RepID=UPI001E2ABCB7|nr:nitroreductase [Limosilactobacillus reuteri]MCC4341501.1 nitroreductase [Limosilactobacillus reuteri]
MNFKETVYNRHSTRDFSSKSVSTKDIHTIIDMAKMAPSWANDQVWKVVVATGKTLEKIKERHYQALLNGIPGQSEFPPLHRTGMGKQGQQNVTIWSNSFRTFLGKNAEQMAIDSAHLFNAPSVAYLLLPNSPSLWSAYDLGAFGQTLMLAATSIGIDSIPAAEFVQYPQDLHDILDVDNNYIFGIGIGLGYKKDNALINDFRSKRMNNSDFLTIKY